jgi:hypothetical protein
MLLVSVAESTQKIIHTRCVQNQMWKSEITSIQIFVGTWLFQDFLRPPRTYHLQQSIYGQKAAADPFLLLVRTTPSRFVIRLPWDSERSAGFDFTFLKPKNVHCSCIRQIGRLTDHLATFAAIQDPKVRCQRSPFLRPSTEPALGRWYGSFQLENWLGHSLSLLDRSCVGSFAARPSIQWRWQQPWLQQSFSSFWRFFVFNSFDDIICLNDRKRLVHKRIVSQHRQLLQPWFAQTLGGSKF